MRLTANRLYLETFLHDAIEQFALAKLRELEPPPQQELPAASQPLALENGSAALVLSAAPVPDQAPSAEKVTPPETSSAAPDEAPAAAEATPTENGSAAPDQATAAGSDPASGSAGSASQEDSRKQKSEAVSKGAEGSKQRTSGEAPTGAVTANGGEHESASGGDGVQDAGRGERSQGSQGVQNKEGVSKEDEGFSHAADDTSARRESGGLATTSGKEAVSVSGREKSVHRGNAANAAGAAQGIGALVEAAAQDHICSVEDAQSRCDLFCALCTKKPELLHQLMQVYGKVGLSKFESLNLKGGLTIAERMRSTCPSQLQCTAAEMRWLARHLMNP